MNPRETPCLVKFIQIDPSLKKVLSRLKRNPGNSNSITRAETVLGRSIAHILMLHLARTLPPENHGVYAGLTLESPDPELWKTLKNLRQTMIDGKFAVVDRRNARAEN